MSRNKKKNSQSPAPMPPEFIQEILDTGILGYSTNPDDSIWPGERFNLDPTEWIYDHLGRHPLEPILKAIIAAHPSPTPGSDQTRLDQALKQLVGFQLRSGPKERNFPTLLLISEDWWQKYDPDGPEPNFAEIARKRVDMARMDAEQEKNKIDEYRKAFDRSKDALLKIVTGRSSEEQQQRRHKEQQIIKLLSDLGVAVASAGESA